MHTSTKNQAKGDVVLTDTTLANFDNSASVFTQKMKRWIQLLSGGLVFGLSLSMLGVTPAMAGSFTFTKIADNQSDFTGISSGAAINDSGTVAFVTTLKNSSDKNSSETLYTSDGVSNTEIINTNQVRALLEQPVLTRFAFTLGSSLNINNNGTVALKATRADEISTDWLLVIQGGSLTIRGTETLRNGSGGSSIGDFALNQLDDVAYLTTASSKGGQFTSLVLTSANHPAVTIAQRSIYYGPMPNFLNRIYSFDINNQSEVIFAATTEPPPTMPNPVTSAIFSSNGGEPTSIVETDASALSVNDKGNILLSNTGIRLFDRSTGTLRTIADTSSGSFQRFGAPAINNNDNVAFTATLNGGEKGIFTGADPVADKVIATGDSLEGSTVTDLNFLGRAGLNNLGQIAFQVVLANGERAIYRADPVAETDVSQSEPQVEDGSEVNTPL